MDTEKREAHLKQTIWKLAHAKRAVVHVRAACDGYETLVANYDHPLHIPLMCAISVTYSRPFTNNNGVGMITQRLSRYTDPTLQKVHDLLWTTRNILSAHSDAGILVREADGGEAAPQDIQIIVTRKSTPRGFMMSFHHVFDEKNLIGVSIPDVRRLCDEFDRRLDEEIHANMSQLYGPRISELARTLDEAPVDYLSFPLGFVPGPPKANKR